MTVFASERDLVGAALMLGAEQVSGWSEAERRLAATVTAGGVPTVVNGLRDALLVGDDPLGEAFCQLRSAVCRRESGQTLTPQPVVDAMVAWAATHPDPVRVVDPGTGSARFLAAAGHQWPSAQLVGVETDPLLAMTGRATLAAAGMADRALITVTDYRALRLPPADGPTLFLGNPPYVRHHRVPPRWKQWLRPAAASMGLPASGLADLYVHFFLATALHARPGDAGALITAAEWLNVNYGSLVRALLLGPLGGVAVHAVDPAEPVFAGAVTTAAITCFLPGTEPGVIRMRRVPRLSQLGDLTGGTAVAARVLRAAPRWGPLFAATPGRAAGMALPAGYVQLGELCRVHRGQVTGANKVWIVSPDWEGVPRRYVFAAITRASELFEAGHALDGTVGLRCVIDLPADLAELSAAERRCVNDFLRRATVAGAADSYVAQRRHPWWRVRLAAPAPIVATYMARRPPAFVRNLAAARHVNIAHGLYPREPMPPAALDALAAYLRKSVSLADGRVYAGGLTKFEPREMERLPVPEPGLLPPASDPAGEPHV